MRKPGPISERLREYVRLRVRKDARYYERGNGSRLAEFLKVDSGWVTTYTDPNPTAHATFDQAIAICTFYGIKIDALLKPKGLTRTPSTPAVPLDRLSQGVQEAVASGRLVGEMATNAEHLVNVLRGLAGLPALGSAPARRRARKA